MPANNLIVNLTSSPIIYNINYHLSGGQLDTDKNTYTIETATFDLAIPNKNHNEFMGWYNNDNFDGNVLTSIELGSYGDIDVYAKWKRNYVLGDVNLDDTIIDANAVYLLMHTFFENDYPLE